MPDAGRSRSPQLRNRHPVRKIQRTASSSATRNSVIALLNPVVYLISGFRWSFTGRGDVDPVISFGAITLFLVALLLAVRWIFRTGWRLRS